MARRDLLNKLADAGEDAIARLADAPRGARVLGAAGSLRDRVDELQRKVRGIDDLERRVAELERRLAEREGGGVTAPSDAAADIAAGTAATEAETDAAAAAGVTSPEQTSATTKGGRARRSRRRPEADEA